MGKRVEEGDPLIGLTVLRAALDGLPDENWACAAFLFLFFHDLSGSAFSHIHMNATALGTMLAPNCLGPLEQSDDITALINDAKNSAVVFEALITHAPALFLVDNRARIERVRVPEEKEPRPVGAPALADNHDEDASFLAAGDNTKAGDSESGDGDNSFSPLDMISSNVRSLSNSLMSSFNLGGSPEEPPGSKSTGEEHSTWL